MGKRFIETSLKSYRKRVEYEKNRAIKAIQENNLTTAVLSVTEAARLQAVIEELEFILEDMEASND
jgi:hypothetical protein